MVTDFQEEAPDQLAASITKYGWSGDRARFTDFVRRELTELQWGSRGGHRRALWPSGSLPQTKAQTLGLAIGRGKSVILSLVEFSLVSDPLHFSFTSAFT